MSGNDTNTCTVYDWCTGHGRSEMADAAVTHTSEAAVLWKSGGEGDVWVSIDQHEDGPITVGIRIDGPNTHISATAEDLKGPITVLLHRLEVFRQRALVDPVGTLQLLLELPDDAYPAYFGDPS